jgi:hypothetical protein
MTNVKKISENFKRLSVLNNRFEKLVELNRIHQYCTMDADVINPKQRKYTHLLLAIKKEKQLIWAANRNLSEKTAENIENAKKATLKYLTS